MKLSTATKRILSALTVAIALVVAIGAIPTSSQKQGAIEWAKALGENQRVQWASTGQLQQLPILYRQALFSTLTSSEQRATAWRGVFTAFRQSRVLSPHESELLARAEALITPAIFVGRRTAAQQQAIAGVRIEVERVLGNDAMRYLYKAFGPTADITTGMPVTEWAKWAARGYGETLPALGPLNADDRDCMCNKAANNDCTGYQNCASPLSCNEREPWYGCGDADWCDGLCSYDIPPGR